MTATHTSREAAGARRAAIYAHESVDAVGDAHNVAGQQAVAEPYAERHHLTVAAVFTGNDISAKNPGWRPGYEAMMEAAARAQFEVIIVTHTSRLWRNRRERAGGTRSSAPPASRCWPSRTPRWT